MARSGRALAVTALAVLAFAGCRNVQTPAGYVGYVTQGAILGKSRFYALQSGPTSSGLGWLLSVINVSVTPYTYTEDFTADNAVLSRRTYARDEVQKLNGLEIKDRITEVGDAIAKRMATLTKDTPFAVISAVVGNIQYPKEVADAVAEKMAATQVLERKQTEIEIEQREAQKRVVQAEGIGKAMAIINERLTSQYLQHEAIEAQKAMVGSPNHSTVYLPVGPMGVPLVGTLEHGK